MKSYDIESLTEINSTWYFNYEGIPLDIQAPGEIFIRIQDINWTDARVPIWIDEVAEASEDYIATARLMTVRKYIKVCDERIIEFLSAKPIMEMTEYELIKLDQSLSIARSVFSSLMPNDVWDDVRRKASRIIRDPDTIQVSQARCEQVWYCLMALQLRIFKRMTELRFLKKYPNPMQGYIYLYGPIEGQHKIGLSVDPSRRANEFVPRTIIPIKAEMVHVFPTNHMKAAEDDLHERFADYRTEGEWFKLSEEHIKEICAIESMMFDWLPATA